MKWDKVYVVKESEWCDKQMLCFEDTLPFQTHQPQRCLQGFMNIRLINSAFVDVLSIIVL